MSSIKPKSSHSDPSTPRDPFAALRFRDYRFFTIGKTLLFTSIQMQTVALGWELYERTGSALALGSIGLAQVIPMIALTLITGHIADRYDRQRTVITSITLMMICSLALMVISYHQLALVWVYGFLFLNGVARAFIKPASDALMFQLIPVSTFVNAATWSSTSFQTAAVLGPALGGFAIAGFGQATGVYGLAAAIFLLCLIAMFLIQSHPTVPSKERLSLKALMAGAAFVWQNQLILAAIALDMFAVLLGGAVALLPIFAKDILHVGPIELGWLQAAPSIGSIIMAIAIAYLPPMRQAGPALLWSVVGFGVVIIVFGLSRSLPLSLLMLALSGALDSISVVIRHTLVQIRTPDALRGRVAAINSVFISASNELGGFESGLTAALFGPVLSVVGGGIGTILVVIAAAAIWPQIRRLDKLHD
jgi:MFS family permease